MKNFFMIFQEFLYDIAHNFLKPFSGLFKKNSVVEKILIGLEKVGKGAVYNCQMCGECILHSTGMVCSMNCPKTLRNGPCGGVRLNGNCEVKPEMKCVWVRAFENATQMPKYGSEMMWIQAPVDRTMKDSSAWVNIYQEVDPKKMSNWQTEEDNLRLQEMWRVE
ncbi:MAG: hypothetical protein HON98_02965 [Chloroflexi bacterium]|jgi:hypothetical protein|nr:hypothetical protein [Chloroflexota bacterium]MBT3670317.1 hypothetical protein [Chloroflexota bacterium]MBT4002619.1 hypothetical protein [Chloroflexota bacterium]MBT4305505.1 hypothetical protein [Chloroflexota bacterium]MBT4533116.1 hypothetical protein [Chloroflexota bacterium]